VIPVDCRLDDPGAGPERTAEPVTPPVRPRDALHLSAVRAWQALTSGEPTPDLDPAVLQEAIYEAFVTSDGHPVDRLCDGWLELARRCGLPVEDESGDLRPEVLDAITHTVSEAIWFGLTTGHLVLTDEYHVPGRFLRS
jgi:hypothetical protein